jgi:hypothetical protein
MIPSRRRPVRDVRVASSTLALAAAVLAACRTGPTPAPAGTPPPLAGAPADARPGRAPGAAEAGVTSDCHPYAIASDGPVDYMNNSWAQGRAQGAFEQCVVARATAAGTEHGWTWTWPGFDPGGFGFPEIIFGWKPWSARSTDARLPIRVADLGELAVRYAVSTRQTGRSSLATSLWLTASGAATAPDPLSIANEIVVWLDYPDDVSPPGVREDGLVRVDGADYELWHEANHGDRGNGTGWDLHYFKGPKHPPRATVRLDAFLAALVARKAVEADRFVASVELGNEVMGGSGTTWVHGFGVVVTRRR